MNLFQKIERKVLRTLESYIGRRFSTRHPNRIEFLLIQAGRPLVKRMIPNDRWSLQVHAKHLVSAARLPCRSLTTDTKNIALFVSYRGEFARCLALSAMLAWRGHRITVLYLPRLQSPSKQPIGDSPDAGLYLRKALREVNEASGDRICCLDLSTIALTDDPVNQEFLQTRASLDTVMALRRESFDPKDPLVSFHLGHYRELGNVVQQSMRALISESSFDLFLVPNGATYATAHVVNVLKEFGLPFTCFDKFSVRNSKLINHGGNIMELNDIEAIWKNREGLRLLSGPRLEQCCNVAIHMLDERRRGMVLNWATRTQTGKPFGADAVRASIGLHPSEPFLLIATNVPFDAGLAEITTIFPSMREWLMETLRCALICGPTRIVVKTHPDESKWSAIETVADIVQESGLDKSRFIIVDSPLINAYDLIEASTAGIVFSSTIGLEMAMLGKPVLLGSKVYYSGKGFTLDSVDQVDYFGKLSSLVKDPMKFQPQLEQTKTAQLYHYLLHHAAQWPYPFMKPSDLRQNRLHDLLGSKEIERFMPMLDALCESRIDELISMIEKKQGW